MMHALRCVLVLGLASCLEALRNRILLVVVAFAVLLIGLSVSAASLSIGERARLIIDVGLAASSALGGGIALVLTITSFAREIERRTAYPVLARPVPRWAFVLGKYVGVLGVMIVLTSAMLVATAATVLAYGDSLPRALWPTFWLTWLEMAVIIGLALLFSCYTSPTLAAIYTASFWLAGQLAGGIAELAERLTTKAPLLAALLEGAYYLLPDLEALSLRVQAANDLDVPAGLVAWATLYAAAYTTACLALAMGIFSRRRAL